MLNRRISIAPMMDWTDRHDRYFLRLISPNVLLYTEMVTANALIHGKAYHLLEFDRAEHPLALQLGGSEPSKLAASAQLGEEYGYREINLNVGCPSDRVQSGQFGACLMLEPERVAESIAAMKNAVRIPVTVKCRIGVDNQDSYAELVHFIQTVHAAGCEIFVIHARKAWLNGLSPKENREIPPLQYDTVYQLKKDFPQLTIILNGGVKTIAQIDEHLQHVDGVMIGREAYTNPYFLAEIEKHYFPDSYSLKNRDEIVRALLPYVEQQLKNNVRLSNITRHILGLYSNQKNARVWRRYLSENAPKKDSGINVIVEALSTVTMD